MASWFYAQFIDVASTLRAICCVPVLPMCNHSYAHTMRPDSITRLWRYRWPTFLFSDCLALFMC